MVSALTSEADYVFIPEMPPPYDWPEKLCRKLDQVSDYLTRYICTFPKQVYQLDFFPAVNCETSIFLYQVKRLATYFFTHTFIFIIRLSFSVFFFVSMYNVLASIGGCPCVTLTTFDTMKSPSKVVSFVLYKEKLYCNLRYVF